MRIAIGGMLHESNTFASAKTRYEDFAQPDLMQWAASNHEVSGFLTGPFETYPTVVAQATPSGVVTDSALERLTGEMAARLKTAPPLDGMLLALHGAMVAESYPQADAEALRRIRAVVGPKFPIVVTHDFHANIAPEMVELSTALLTYQTNPHVDQRVRGVKAAQLMARIARGEVRPVQALAKPPMLFNILHQNTSVEPLLSIVEESRRLERSARILGASVSGGYQYADVEQVGPGVVVIADGDAAMAKREAERLSGMLWAVRDRLKVELPDAAGAVKQAMASDRFPVVLVDMGDNIGGGSAGDSTFLLSELIRQKAQGWVMVIADPEAVRRARAGEPFDAMVGGKTDALHGEPVRVRGHVRSLHDGRYTETEVRHGGQRDHDQGPTAVVEVPGTSGEVPNLLMLTSKRQPPFSLQQLVSCGIDPARQKVLVVKAAIAYRAAYEPVARRIIEVDTGGVTAVNPRRFTWRRARRPLFGLD